MAVFVNTNFSALQGQRYLGNVNTQLTTTYQRLSSGLRINSAKDDAAGLQIADRLTSQINGLNQGNRNASDGIALLQTIEGSMDEMSNMLQKIRTLAVQATNGTNTAADRDALAKEASALGTEIARIATQTTYAGKKVLIGPESQISKDSLFLNKGTAVAGVQTGQLTLQVGSNKGDVINVDVMSMRFNEIFVLANQDKALDNVLDAKGGPVTGAPNVDGMIAYSMANHIVKFNFNATFGKTDIGYVIQAMDRMIGVVDGERAKLGAMMNRLESSIRNQSNVAANEADARSRIRDADFAEESANLTQQNIIQQAASSMLMQANTRPQLGLSLLG